MSLIEHVFITFLLGLHTLAYTVRAFCFGRCVCRLSVVCHLSVCTASHLGNYARYVRNFAVRLGNQGRRARIWRQILQTLLAWFLVDIFFWWWVFRHTGFRSLFSSLGYLAYPFVPEWFKPFGRKFFRMGVGDAKSGKCIPTSYKGAGIGKQNNCWWSSACLRALKQRSLFSHSTIRHYLANISRGTLKACRCTLLLPVHVVL